MQSTKVDSFRALFEFLFITIMKPFVAYVRVSTTRQGELGVSLDQQKDAITQYAQKNQLSISSWFTEQETAAKRGIKPI